MDVANQHAFNRSQSMFDKNELKSYHILSANLLKFMPNINADNHRDIYENLLKIRVLENIPQFFKTFDLNNFFSNFSEDNFCRNSPVIYISYHMGAYRSAILPMVKYNRNIAIVIDTSIYTMEDLEKELGAHFNLAKEFFPTSTSQLKILAANDKNTMIELMDKIHKGYSILTYIDWNSGFNNTKNNITIDFYNEKISVRPSIAYLSFYSKCPIIPFISYYNNEYEPNWCVFDSINPNEFASAHEYALHAMCKLYHNLEEMIPQYYNQWHGWFHIHKSVVSKSYDCFFKNDFNADLLYKRNEYAGLFVILDSYFIINKLSYKIIKLTKVLYDYLFSNNYLDKDLIDLTVLEQLYQNGMLEKK